MPTRKPMTEREIKIAQLLQPLGVLLPEEVAEMRTGQYEEWPPEDTRILDLDDLW